MAVSEASGLAASQRQPGVWWTHNDSGGKPRVYALADDGRPVGDWYVTGATAEDWEDLAIAPCRHARHLDCLYVGDIGDNLRSRDHVVVYAFPEPTVSPGTETRSGTLKEPVSAIHLTYPDGSEDAEALLVDGRRSRLYVITKDTGRPPRVFAVALDPARAQARFVEEGTVRLGSPLLPVSRMVTSGAYSPDGEWVVLRTYSAAYLWRRHGDEGLGVTLSRDPCSVPVFPEPQGEAISFDRTGNEIVTLSEGVHQPLNRVGPLVLDPSGSARLPDPRE
ncbi:MAG: hypothetical protein JW751_19440 [Polyangiaceae bacterium]|nr:hypothetical protein [Polyangiaceae bacterium]